MSRLNQNRIGYKETIVGWIPNEWEIRPFREIASRRKDRFDPNSNGKSFKCIELEHIEQGSGVILGYVDSSKLASSKNKFFPGDVLFGKLRPYLRKYAHIDFEGVCSSEIWVLKNQKPSISEYVYLIVQSNKFIAFSNKTSGTKMPRSEWDLISDVLFPLPPIYEQRKITEILRYCDKEIELVGKQIESKQRLKNGLMQQLLTGKMRFPQFGKPRIANRLPPGWHKVALEKLLVPVTRFVNWDENAIYDQAIVRRWSQGLQYRDLLFGHQIKTKTLQQIYEDDFLISNIQAAYGAMARVTEKFHNAHVSNLYTILNPRNEDSMDIYYLDYLSQMPRFRHLVVVSANGFKAERIRLNFSLPNFLKEKIIVPIAIEEQRKIASTFLFLDREIGQLSKKKQNLEFQKRGLMQKLLSGEMRVKV